MTQITEPAVALPMDEIRALCRKYHVRELALFGSIVRDDFRSDSDIDFLARFDNDDLGPWMSHLTELQDELARLLGRKVDVVDWKAIEGSRNLYRKQHILGAATTIYGS